MPADGKGSPYLVVVEPNHQEEFSVVAEKGFGRWLDAPANRQADNHSFKRI